MRIWHNLFILTTTLLAGCLGSQIKTAQEKHRLVTSTPENYRHLSSQGDNDHLNSILDHILIPRVVGTKNHEKVFAYIVHQLQSLGWSVHVDQFQDKAPILGELIFKNIVATHDPRANRHLVLACHYDSKYFPGDHFVGAIDSAVPCAMMLGIARSLSGLLGGGEVSLKLIFFDGEEAFENWGPRDSIYGARHLARAMYGNRTRLASGEVVSELDKIDVLILLDLIGHKNPTFVNYFPETGRWFERLREIEGELHRLGLLRGHQYWYFRAERPYGRIEDDHIPFLAKGVPILHLISSPFPPEWHTPGDNRDLIDKDTVDNLSLILKVFVSEYLNLFKAQDPVAESSDRVLWLWYIFITVELVTLLLYLHLRFLVKHHLFV